MIDPLGAEVSSPKEFTAGPGITLFHYKVDEKRKWLPAGAAVWEGLHVLSMFVWWR